MKIVFNGREYGSVDEMPADARAVYQKAVASLSGSTAEGVRLNVKTKTKLVVNGKEYGSLDDVPKDVRTLYDFATQGGTGRVSVGGVEIGTSSQAAWLVAGVVLGAGLVLGVLLWITA